MSTLTIPRTGRHVSVASAMSHCADADEAVTELASALGSTADLYAVFVTSGYDLTAVGAALRRWGGDRIIGCTTSGNIGPLGYDAQGICAVALTGGGLRARTTVLGPLDDPGEAVERAGVSLIGLRAELEDGDGFAILLTDGLTNNEDPLAASLMAALGDVPIIGGSAGDDLTFTRTAVYHDGVFADNCATVTVVRLDAPFRLFRLQHHEPTDTVLVATDVDPARRILRQLNGRPAVDVYAEAIGLSPAEAGPVIFSKHPVLLKAAGSSWVRSIAEILDDGSMRMFARVDVGDVLRLGRPVGMIEKLTEGLEAVSIELGSVSGMLAFDCILRRLEFEEHGVADQVGAILAGYHTTGFSTYGEQFNGMHVNQTLVAVAFA